MFNVQQGMFNREFFALLTRAAGFAILPPLFPPQQNNMVNNTRKVTILGAGNVGATIAYTLTIDGLCSEICLIDAAKEKAVGEALDIQQGLAFNRWMHIYAGDYADAKGSDIVIISMGVGRREGQTRLDLAQTNLNILRQVASEIIRHAPDAIYIVVSNPVDLMTHCLIRESGIPAHRIIGTGTLLDSSRLRSIIAREVRLTSRNVHTYVLGEHGDTSVVPWSVFNVSGMPLNEYCRQTHAAPEFDDARRAAIENEMRTSGGRIIQYKRATYYAIAMSVHYLCEAIFRNTRCILTLSTLMNGEYGIHDVALSVPIIVDRNGAGQKLILPLAPAELEALQHSAEALRNASVPLV